MNVLQNFVGDAKRLKGSVIFPEGDEDRTLEAAVRLAADRVGNIIVTAADTAAVRAVARRKKLDISGVKLLAPALELLSDDALRQFVAHLGHKGVSEKKARALALEPLYFAALYVRSGGADCMVAGARSDTADVLRAAIYGIGGSVETRLISSFFLMVPPDGHPVAKTPVLFADCAVNPEPTAMGLEAIALATVRSHKLLMPGQKVRVAFLSFSTKGSAAYPALKKIRDAAGAAAEYFSPDKMVAVDGELQFDTAVMPQVAKRKAPGSPVGGNANVFIFPDLNAGNICYKMAERYGRFIAIGPILQGVKKPVSDLSRGCSVDDIYYAAVITLIQSGNQKQ